MGPGIRRGVPADAGELLNMTVRVGKGLKASGGGIAACNPKIGLQLVWRNAEMPKCRNAEMPKCQ
ncbi:hypothetical protein [Cohnella sp. REN36]|uniref:hypothetical protein n=1 Tax=Cohnella sp. REN36 TaxID=2887347 RepID=UPI001D151548|nr:hypothetical protein [Cohnella sp. REN36]MCC3376344.1 hypothetical protein [Cohnella sp. REN36]